jgi:uncharacterized phiE125 gp8 family phage protein
VAINQITPPALEPVHLVEAKAHLRITEADEDVLISALITAAREYCEGFQNRAYLTQTWELWLDNFPVRDYIKLPQPPLQSVDSIKYYSTDNTEYTMDQADYFVDPKNEPGKVGLAYGKRWPSITLRPFNAVCVQFVAGYPAYSGTVTTDGIAVTKDGGDDFLTTWSVGKSIVINGVAYSIAAVGSNTGLTLAATAGVQAAAVPYSTNDVPTKIKQAILLILGDLYENRENTIVGAQAYELPVAAKALLWQDRIVPI